MNKLIAYNLLLSSALLASCQTLETGGKVVDSNRKEVIISSNGDDRSALPQGRKDTSLTKARERLEAHVKTSPKDLKALLSLAELQLAQDNLAEAETTSRRVLLLDVKSQDARRVLAQIAIRRNNYDMAMIFLTALGGEQSKESSVLNMLGLVAFNRQDNGEAMRMWKQALNLNPGDISVRMNMGVLYLKNRLLAQASTQFERVLKVAPNHQDARLHLAIIDAARGKNKEAIETYKSILTQDATNQLVLFNLAAAQKNVGQFDEALENLKKFIKISPETSENTNQAFAMIDDINNLKLAKGEKVSDEDLVALAQELATRKSLQKNQPAGGQGASANSSNNKKSSTSTTAITKQAKSEALVEPSVNDQEIEALEKQLNTPAH